MYLTDNYISRFSTITLVNNYSEYIGCYKVFISFGFETVTYTKVGKVGFSMPINLETFEQCNLQVAGTSLPVAGSWPATGRCRQEGRTSRHRTPSSGMVISGRPTCIRLLGTRLVLQPDHLPAHAHNFAIKLNNPYFYSLTFHQPYFTVEINSRPSESHRLRKRMIGNTSLSVGHNADGRTVRLGSEQKHAP